MNLDGDATYDALGRAFDPALRTQGQKLGAPDAVVESTAAGHRLYLGLGFEDVGSFRVMLRSA